MVAIFTDNVSLCKKLAPQFVVSILKHIRKSQKTAAKSLKLLQTIAMPSGTSNRPIQSLILKQVRIFEFSLSILFFHLFLFLLLFYLLVLFSLFKFAYSDNRLWHNRRISAHFLILIHATI